jgi:glycosyltransferase involved in cell wall biosynthesis
VQIRSRSFTFRRLRDADLSIVLSKYNRTDAEKLFPKSIRVVSNGIPDPCPHFAEEILPRRKARFAARTALASGARLASLSLENTGGDPQQLKVLYLAHCTREKGLFDTLKGVLWANERLAKDNSPFSIELMVAGNFVTAEERAEFDRICATPEGEKCVRYLGFVSGAQKVKALQEADLFCFPTFYQNENQPVNLIEAMAFGLPILATRWRSIPELFPSGYPWLIDVGAPGQIADALLACLTAETTEYFRDIFLGHYTLEQYLAGLAEAIHSVESTGPAAAEPALALPAGRAASPPPHAR